MASRPLLLAVLLLSQQCTGSGSAEPEPSPSPSPHYEDALAQALLPMKSVPPLTLSPSDVDCPVNLGAAKVLSHELLADMQGGGADVSHAAAGASSALKVELDASCADGSGNEARCNPTRELDILMARGCTPQEITIIDSWTDSGEPEVFTIVVSMTLEEARAVTRVVFANEPNSIYYRSTLYGEPNYHHDGSGNMLIKFTKQPDGSIHNTKQDGSTFTILS